MEQRIGFVSGSASGVAARDVIVRDDADHGAIEVVGLSGDEVTAALRLLSRVRQLSGEMTATLQSQMLSVLVGEREPVTSTAELTSAQAVASLRARLLQSGHETYETLAARRGASAATTRAWVKRMRDSGSLFTVQHAGRTVLPAFQFDAARGVEPNSAAVIRLLSGVGLDGWQLWEWMASPTGWLDGNIPAELLATEPDVVLEAARQYAEELRLGRRGAVAAGQTSAV